MKKIILSLIFVMIALAGVSCASASDFNETVEIDQNINAIDDVAVNDTEAQASNDSSKVVENKTIDPVEQYSTQYKNLKEKYSNSWFNVAEYQALFYLSCELKNNYDEATAINMLTDVFCLVEFGNPCNLVKTVAHQMVADLYHQWHYDNGWQKYTNKNIPINLNPNSPGSDPHPLC